MKIITPGRHQRGWSKTCLCSGSGNGGGGCKAKLLVEETDFYTTRSHHYDGSIDHHVTFQCPACGVQTDIKNLPPSIQKKLPSSKL